MSHSQRALWLLGRDNIPRHANGAKGGRQEARYTLHEGDAAWTALDPLIREQEVFQAIRATKEDWADNE